MGMPAAVVKPEFSTFLGRWAVRGGGRARVRPEGFMGPCKLSQVGDLCFDMLGLFLVKGRRQKAKNSFI